MKWGQQNTCLAWKDNPQNPPQVRSLVSKIRPKNFDQVAELQVPVFESQETMGSGISANGYLIFLHPQFPQLFNGGNSTAFEFGRQYVDLATDAL